jgi:hypothetical protein
MNTIACGNCGGKVKLPAGFSKAKIRCEHCGYYAEVPAEMRSTAPPEEEAPTSSRSAPPPTQPRRKRTDENTPPPPPKVRARSDPRDSRPEFIPEENAGPRLLEGTQEEDDQPYPVHGTGLKNCPECHQELPLNAIFCVHCGSHLSELDRDRPKKRRKYEVIDESFIEGFTMPTRLTLFAAAQVLNVVFTILALSASSWKIDTTAIVTGTLSAMINATLQAFILGSYDTLRVRRDEYGKATLTRIRRICFFPLPPVKIPWKKSVGVGRYASYAGDVFAWATCIYLFLCAACLPGILFWWFVLKPERQNVALADVYGGIEETVFHSKNQEVAVRVVEVIVEATGLQARGVL